MKYSISMKNKNKMYYNIKKFIVINLQVNIFISGLLYETKKIRNIFNYYNK